MTKRYRKNKKGLGTKGVRALAMTASLSLFASLAQAQTTYNIGTTGAIGTGTGWTTGTAWNPNITGGPINGDSISISGLAVEKQINLDAVTHTLVDLTYNDTNTVVFSSAATSPVPTLALTGTLTKDGAGTLVFASKSSGGALNVNLTNIDVKTGTLSLGAGTVSGGSFKGINILTVSGTTAVASGSTLNVAAAYSGGGNSSRTLGTVTNNGTLNIGTAGSGNAAATFAFNGLSGAGSINSGVQASAITSGILFTQAAGSTTFSGAMTEGTNNKINITHQGAGVQVLSGATGYTGTTVINGGGTLVYSGTSTVGGTGLGLITISGGTIANQGSVIGVGNGDLTTYGFALTGSGNIAITGAGGFAAYGADRTVTMTNGALTWATGGFVAAQGANPGIFVLGDSTSTHKLTFTNDIALGTVARTVLTNDGTGAVDGSLTGVVSSGSGGALVKDGTGTLEVKGANTYSSGTTVSAGTLLVNNTVGSSGTGTGGVLVSSGGTLGGAGYIATAANAGISLSLGGKLAPGSGGAGTLTADLGTGTLDLSAATAATNSGALVFELASVGASDKFALSNGTLNIGTLEFDDFSFTALSGFGVGTYTLFDANSAITGSLGSLVSGMIGGFSGTLSLGGTNDLLLTVSAVPEPSTYALLGIGLGALWFLRRRQAKA